VVRDRVSLPNGRDATMDVVRHRASVILIPMPDPEHIVLVRQYRYSIDRWIWEIPAGNTEPEEHPEVAARRECEEEIGQVPGVVERLGSFYPTPGYCDEEMIFFRLTGLTTPATPAPPDDDELLEPRVFSVDEARRMVERGEIVDMKTALGLELI
jgi:ADP-ribose pyrophosphatase